MISQFNSCPEAFLTVRVIKPIFWSGQGRVTTGAMEIEGRGWYRMKVQLEQVLEASHQQNYSDQLRVLSSYICEVFHPVNHDLEFVHVMRHFWQACDSLKIRVHIIVEFKSEINGPFVHADPVPNQNA